MKGIFRRIFKILPFFIIVAAGLGIYQFLAQAKEPPPRDDKSHNAMVVEVEKATNSKKQVTVSATGLVMPSRTVTLIPEISGKITHCNPKLVPGGRLKAGETVLKISPKEYDLFLQQQRSVVAQAEMELSMEQGRKRVAEQEWSLIKKEVEPTEEGRKLALRETQLGAAKASLAAAESTLEIAKINRKRTVIGAPFNAIVTEKFVDIGQVVGPGCKVATLVDSDTFWVGVSVPVHQLPWISVPNINGNEGSPALIIQEVSDELKARYGGRVLRLLGGVDPNGKMARLIIEVEDPLKPLPGSTDQTKTEGDSENAPQEPLFPLLIDSHVTVEIQGPELDDVIEVPRHALRKGDSIWVLSKENKLAVKKVNVLWTRGQRAFVRGDLAPGDDVITSRIEAPVDGMDLRLEGKKEDPKGGKEQKI
jgi:multidrug efflux pump subunit AcrA (membrane-fusion protein)